MDHPPAYSPRLGRPTKLTPYLPYLRQKWEEGCRNARQLYVELVARGYRGAETRVKDAVHPWRALCLRRTTGGAALPHSTGWFLNPSKG